MVDAAPEQPAGPRPASRPRRSARRGAPRRTTAARPGPRARRFATRSSPVAWRRRMASSTCSCRARELEIVDIDAPARLRAAQPGQPVQRMEVGPLRCPRRRPARSRRRESRCACPGSSSLATVAVSRKVRGPSAASCQSWRIPTPASGSSLRSRSVPFSTVIPPRSPSTCQPAGASPGAAVGCRAVGDGGEGRVERPGRGHGLELAQMGERQQRQARPAAAAAASHSAVALPQRARPARQIACAVIASRPTLHHGAIGTSPTGINVRAAPFFRSRGLSW